VRIITDDVALVFHPGHPERPERITAAREKLRSQTSLPITWSAPGRAMTRPLLRAHTVEHLSRLSRLEDFDDDTRPTQTCWITRAHRWALRSKR